MSIRSLKVRKLEIIRRGRSGLLVTIHEYLMFPDISGCFGGLDGRGADIHGLSGLNLWWPRQGRCSAHSSFDVERAVCAFISTCIMPPGFGDRSSFSS